MIPRCRVEPSESFPVKLKIRKTFTERATDLLRYSCYTLLTLTVLFLLTGLYPLLNANCYQPPTLTLNNITVHNMTITRSNLTSTRSDPTSTRSSLTYAVDIALLLHNSNTLPGCAIQYRTATITTAYRGDAIQQLDFLRGFSQPRGGVRDVVVEMHGEGIPLNQSNVVFFQSEVQNGNVLMEVVVGVRCRVSVRKMKWHHVKCQVIVNTPSESRTVGQMLYHKCSVV